MTKQMTKQAYTLAKYRVKPGKAEAFIAAWRELAKTFSSLPAPPIWGTLIRSTTDPAVFYSFGPWRDAKDVQAMRSDSSAIEAFERIGSLCAEMSPGNYEVVEHVEVKGTGRA